MMRVNDAALVAMRLIVPDGLAQRARMAAKRMPKMA